MRAKKLLRLFGFSAISRLNGEDLLNETWHRQSGKGVGQYEWSPTLLVICCPKVSRTSVHKRLKTRLEFLPTLTISFCPSPSHTLYAALTWRSTTFLNETALGSSAAQIWNSKRCQIGNAIASGGPSGNTWLQFPHSSLKMHVRSLRYTIPVQSGGPKTTFYRQLCNITATMTAYVFGTKPVIHT